MTAHTGPMSNGQLSAMSAEDRADTIDAMPEGMRRKLAHIASLGAQRNAARLLEPGTHPTRGLAGDAARLAGLAAELTADRPTPDAYSAIVHPEES